MGKDPSHRGLQRARTWQAGPLPQGRPARLVCLELQAHFRVFLPQLLGTSPQAIPKGSNSRVPTGHAVKKSRPRLGQWERTGMQGCAPRPTVQAAPTSPHSTRPTQPCSRRHTLALKTQGGASFLYED